MKTIKLNVHSVIDLITNSSTEMFADYSNSIEPLKELLDEFLKLSGVNKTSDEIFEISIINSYWEENLEYYMEDYPEISEEEAIKKVKEPDGENPTELLISSKDSKYDSLIEAFNNFMNSVELSEYMC